MLQNQHFISFIVWNFHSNRLLFLRLMQENKSGCFFFWTQYTNKPVRLAVSFWDTFNVYVPYRPCWSFLLLTLELGSLPLLYYFKVITTLYLLLANKKNICWKLWWFVITFCSAVYPTADDRARKLSCPHNCSQNCNTRKQELSYRKQIARQLRTQ